MTNRITRVDPFSAVPKYYQLHDILQQKIEDGVWRPHESLPSERELESLYNVSRTTIREALGILEKEGYIYREHGRGTFVSRPKLQYSLNMLSSFTDDMKLRGFVAGQQLLHLEYVEPSSRVRQQLQVQPRVDHVLRIERLRLANGEPIGIHDAYLPLSRDQRITVEELDEVGSLYTLLESKFNLAAAEADETLEATVANHREATLLQVPVGSPLLLIERTTWSRERRPMELVKMLHRADRYKYYVRLVR
ncbi:MAG: GntR family transcriptional regulator [Ardenticatenaceae bacterium]|nr:GntR family transcriptional regulator [Ardenticatenaceae bacterium]HBY93130.1 phosphonate metabolism transcriptional regulator PhnF [Chloroflexota bacterium]